MPSPYWVTAEPAERAAAVMARQLAGPSESWGTLLAHAQAILEYHTDTLGQTEVDSYGFDLWKDLIAAARILDQASTRNGLREEDDRRTSAILAACAFGMSGTSVSATATIREHNLLMADLTPGELTALALSSPTFSREIFPRLPAGSIHRTCIENIAAFLINGNDRELEAASIALQHATEQEPDPWDGYLLRMSRLTLAHVARLSTIRVLKHAENRFPNAYLDRLVSDNPMLLPSQYEAVTYHGILNRARNLLVSLPTGTGKTLLGELALLSSLGQEPGLVCYIAPYVALGRQVADRIYHHVPPSIRVTPLVGGYKEPSSLEPELRQEVVVATPERFDALLRLRPDLMPFIRCVVFDEAHMVANDQRGIRLEGIITRLKLGAITNEWAPRFILLSAVLSNTGQLANWLNISDDDVVRGTWRPTAKRLLNWAEDGVLRLHAGDDPMRETPSEVLGTTNLPWPNPNLRPTRHFGQIRDQIPLELENIAYLAEFELQQYGQPVLCVCANRPKTRQLAFHIARRLPAVEPVPESVRRLIETIDNKYPYLLPLKTQLEKGVAYHNSSLPHDIRAGLERALERRDLKVVAATTTLAEGVDLPFRVTILVDWLMFDGEQSTPMQSLLFKNIAGRCGRAGQFTEGDTVIFDNPVGDDRYTRPHVRNEIRRGIFFSESQPTLTSAINRLGEENAVSALGSQLLAAVSENPETDNLSGFFATNCFAYQGADGGQTASHRIELALNEILEGKEGEPLAVATSPIRLTPFGEAAKNTGLTPTTAKRLRTTLDEFRDHGTSTADLTHICVRILQLLGNAAEQANAELRKGVSNPKSRPIVRINELNYVVTGWLSGNQLQDIFATTPSKTRSTRRPRVQNWLNGIVEDNSWADEFAKFSEFVDSTMTLFLPWMLRAAQQITELEDHPEKPWNEWANFLELGVDNSWAVRLINQEFITDRATARRVGQALEEGGLELDPHSMAIPSAVSEMIQVSFRTPEEI